MRKERFEKDLKIKTTQDRDEMEEELIQKFLPEIFSNMRSHQVTESLRKELKRK